MKVYCLCFEISGGLWKTEHCLYSIEMILRKRQTACEALGSGGMSPGNFKVYYSKIKVCDNFDLLADRLSNASS